MLVLPLVVARQVAPYELQSPQLARAEEIACHPEVHAQQAQPICRDGVIAEDLRRRQQRHGRPCATVVVIHLVSPSTSLATPLCPQSRSGSRRTALPGTVRRDAAPRHGAGGPHVAAPWQRRNVKEAV